MIIKKRRKRDRLESKVLKLVPSRDEKGFYYPYCSLSWHRGIIQREYVCEKRECKYNHKLYLPKSKK